MVAIDARHGAAGAGAAGAGFGAGFGVFSRTMVWIFGMAFIIRGIMSSAMRLWS